MANKFDVSQFLAAAQNYQPQPMMTPIPQQGEAPVRHMISVPETPGGYQTNFTPDQLKVPTQPSDPAAVQTLTQSQNPRLSMRMNSVLPPTQDEADMTEAFKQLMEGRKANIAQTTQDLSNAKQERADLNGSLQGMDLSSLNGFVDQMTGSHLAQSYKAPTRKQELDQMVQKLGEMNNKNIDGMGQDQLQFLKDRQGLRNNKAMLDMARGDRARQTQDLKLLAEMRKDLGGADDKLSDSMKSIDTVDAAIQSGNYGALKGVLSNLGRGVGGEKGPLSDGDVQRVFPSSVATSLAGLEFYLNGSAAIPADVQRQVMTLVNIGRQNAMNQAQERLATHKQAFSAGAPDLMALGAPGYQTFGAYEDKLKRINGGFNQPAQPAQHKAPGAPMSFEEWKASKRNG